MESDPKEPDEARPARPIPVRPIPAREGVPSPERHGDETPVPAGPGTEEAQAPGDGVEPDVDRRTVELDGATWTVKVEGRAGGGASTGTRPTAPLLLLGFYRQEEDERATREALVVGRALARLTPRQLEEAFATAEAPPDPGRSREIFPGTTSRRGRGGS